MFEESKDVRDRMFTLGWPVTLAIVCLNLGVFFAQYYIAPRFWPNFPIDDVFALSLAGLQHGYVWQLLTYQFMHGGWLHIFGNLLAILVFGRVLEFVVGSMRMLFLFLLSGVVGGIAQVLFSAWQATPDSMSQGIVGASAGAFGLIAAFAVMFPRQPILFLLFFIIPIPMQARTLLRLLLVITVIGILVPFGNIGHMAHLGGALTGCVAALWLLRPLRLRLLREIGRQRDLHISASQC